MNFITLLAKIAPVLASLVNSPLGLAIRQTLAQLLLSKSARNRTLRASKAKPEAMDEALAQALQRASPEQVAQVKRLETDLQSNLAAVTTANPHPPENKPGAINPHPPPNPVPYRDQTSATLAKLITAGFMLILSILIFVPMSQSNRAIDVMLGALSSAWTISVGYYFGEQRKNGKNGNGNGNNHSNNTRKS